MKITAYHERTVFEELQPEWNELLQRSVNDCLFSTWEWQSAWWDAYHPGELWVLAFRDAGGRLVGLAPWFINMIRGERGIRSIGCVDVTDYLDIVVDRGCVEVVQDALAQYLADHTHKFDFLDLCNLPEASPTRIRFAKALEDRGFTVEVRRQAVCPVVELSDNWDGYLAGLSKKYRHELRRKIRRAQNATEGVERYVVGPEHNIHEEMQRFFALMAASHPEKAEFLDDPANTRFFEGIVPLAHERGWLRLSFLTISGEAAATYLDFDYNRQIMVYNSGLLPDKFGHLSPGIVLLAYDIRDAIESGHTVFDFLRGDEPYKYHMGGRDTDVFLLVARPAGD